MRPPGQQLWRWKGVSGRLTFGLIVLFMLTGLIAGGAIYQMRSIMAWVDDLVGARVDQVIEAEHLVQRTHILVQLAPKLLTVVDGFELDNLQGQLTDMFNLLDRSRGLVNDAGSSIVTGQEIAIRRDQLRFTMDLLIVLIDARLKRDAEIERARQRINVLLDAVSTRNAGRAQGIGGTEEVAELAAILFRASLTTNRAQIDRDRQAARVVLGRAPESDFPLPAAELQRLIEGDSSIFTLREVQLEQAERLQGAAADTTLRANQLVYTVANLAAGLRKAAESERAGREQAVAEATGRMIAVVAIAALIALALVVYLQRSVLKRLVDLRNSVYLNTLGEPAPIPEGGTDEIGDVARSVRHFIGEISRREEDLRRLATTDPLTGLANRRAFLEKGHSEIVRCRRLDHPMCVLMMDIDHFKRVNDTWGHGVGDDAIRQVASISGEVFRDIDMVGRMGGEEFAVLVPETSVEGALTAAERMRAAVAARPVLIDGDQTLSMTISIGVAQMTLSDRTITDILGRADDALYAAKNAGRNRVCLSPAGEAATPIVTASAARIDPT